MHSSIILITGWMCDAFAQSISYCCNLSVGVALNAQWLPTGCARRTTPRYVAQTSNKRVIAAHDLYCCLLPQCEALRTCRSGFPIAKYHSTVVT